MFLDFSHCPVDLVGESPGWGRGSSFQACVQVACGLLPVCLLLAAGPTGEEPATPPFCYVGSAKGGEKSS